MTNHISSPILRALVELADAEGVTEVRWADGEILRVRYDILVPADESHDGLEEAVVDVVAVISAGQRSLSGLALGRPGLIRADDLPVRVSTPPR
ncbi:MAG: hypothetical protein ACKOB8_09910 [Mycobacterium sp.]